MAESNADSQQVTIATEFYRAARAEVLQRLAMREQVLLASLTFSGIISGIVIKAGNDVQQLALLIPCFALPFAVAHFRHTRIIEMLGDYMRYELSPILSVPTALPSNADWTKLVTYEKKPDGVRPWNESVVISQKMPGYIRAEGFVNCALLCVPGLIVLGWQLYVGNHRMGAILGALSTLAAVAVVLGHWKSLSQWGTFGGRPNID
jgi:hypothetical protein